MSFPNIFRQYPCYAGILIAYCNYATVLFRGNILSNRVFVHREIYQYMNIPYQTKFLAPQTLAKRVLEVLKTAIPKKNRNETYCCLFMMLVLYASKCANGRLAGSSIEEFPRVNLRMGGLIPLGLTFSTASATDILGIPCIEDDLQT